jgi:hypothetical protein
MEHKLQENTNTKIKTKQRVLRRKKIAKIKI